MRLFQGFHSPNISVEFEYAPGGTKTNATNPTVGQSLVLPFSLANHLLQALMAESRSLTRQISVLSDRWTVLDTTSVTFGVWLRGLQLPHQISRVDFICVFKQGGDGFG
ncbi:flocculation protein FLO11-like [Cucumis melo var. makuwa]|uniref:Flocculation protein FLO11-like n=1 Tax=Cucumis melo var. makuwa TaxID=1194695 RepID=A0A5A7VLQ9_CUCMM|nr:flocculation protein FLO11-like [Cucumis melo var. makuwa]